MCLLEHRFQVSHSSHSALFFGEVWGQCVGGMCLPGPVISGHCVLKYLHDNSPTQDDPSSSQKEYPVMPSFHWYHPKPLFEPKSCRQKGRVCSSQQCKRSPHCPTRPRKQWPHVHQKIPFLASFKTKSSLSHYHEYTESSVFLYRSLQCLLCFVLKNCSPASLPHATAPLAASFHCK